MVERFYHLIGAWLDSWIMAWEAKKCWPLLAATYMNKNNITMLNYAPFINDATYIRSALSIL